MSRDFRHDTEAEPNMRSPSPVSELVERLLTEERVNLGDKVAVKKLLERIAKDACEAALVLTELSSRVAEMERATTTPTGSYSGLIEGLRRRSLESECSTGDPLAAEAATALEAKEAELAAKEEARAKQWRMRREADASRDTALAALTAERAAHAETKRERDEHKRLKNELVLKAYPAMDGADDLIEALGRYGFPVSDAAEPALMEGGSREAQALHKAAKAFITARRVREGGKADG